MHSRTMQQSLKGIRLDCIRLSISMIWVVILNIVQIISMNSLRTEKKKKENSKRDIIT